MSYQRPRLGRRSATPQLERLEMRALLSKVTPKITIQEVALGDQFELLIIGTAKNDSIFITDNGDATTGNMTVTTGDGTTFTSTHAIDDVVAITGGGSDRVTYTLQGDVLKDSTRLIEATSASPAGSDVPAVKGGGNLLFTVNQPDPINGNAKLFAFAQADPKGKTTMVVNESGDVAGEVLAGIETSSTASKPKVGPISFTLNSTSRIDSGGQLEFGATGGTNKNTMSATYIGQNNGDISFGEGGSGSQDLLAVDIEMASGSTGTVGTMGVGTVTATGKKANASLVIRRDGDSSSTTGITAKIVAASKSSTAQQTANVVNQAQGKDTIIS